MVPRPLLDPCRLVRQVKQFAGYCEKIMDIPPSSGLSSHHIPLAGTRWLRHVSRTALSTGGPAPGLSTPLRLDWLALESPIPRRPPCPSPTRNRSRVGKRRPPRPGIVASPRGDPTHAQHHTASLSRNAG